MVSAIYGLALGVGANRIVKGAKIEHVLGDPKMGSEKDRAYSLNLVRIALKTLEQEVTEPTLFDPYEFVKTEKKEVSDAA